MELTLETIEKSEPLPEIIIPEAPENRIDRVLDARGLTCPLPILRAKKAMNDMRTGEVLRVLTTDHGSVKDFTAFCKQTGNHLLSQTEHNKEYEFMIERR